MMQDEYEIMVAAFRAALNANVSICGIEEVALLESAYHCARAAPAGDHASAVKQP
jgi:hypothetical protein